MFRATWGEVGVGAPDMLLLQTIHKHHKHTSLTMRISHGLYKQTRNIQEIYSKINKSKQAPKQNKQANKQTKEQKHQKQNDSNNSGGSN